MAKLHPKQIAGSATNGQVLTTVAGETTWAAPPAGGVPETLLLENGAAVPAGTAVGTLIFEKGITP